MGRVREMIKMQIGDVLMAEGREQTAARVSISLPYEDNRRVEYACKYLGMSKSGFIASVVNAALIEFEEEAGIFKDENHAAQYHGYMMGSEPVEDFDKFMASKPKGE